MNCNKRDEIDEALILLDQAFEARAGGLVAALQRHHPGFDANADLVHSRRLWRTERQALETRMRLSIATAHGQQ